MPTFDETPAGLIGLLSEMDLYKRINWQSYDENSRREPTRKLTEAVCSSSRIHDQSGENPDTERHYLMIDLDVEAHLMPSSTPGHSHLYVKVPIPWRDLVQLLKALAACGIIEHGYAGASIERKSTTLRLPWVKKEPDLNPFEAGVRAAFGAFIELSADPDWDGQSASIGFGATFYQELDRVIEDGLDAFLKTPESDA